MLHEHGQVLTLAWALGSTLLELSVEGRCEISQDRPGGRGEGPGRGHREAETAGVSVHSEGWTRQARIIQRKDWPVSGSWEITSKPPEHPASLPSAGARDQVTKISHTDAPCLCEDPGTRAQGSIPGGNAPRVWSHNGAWRTKCGAVGSAPLGDERELTPGLSQTLPCASFTFVDSHLSFAVTGAKSNRFAEF